MDLPTEADWEYASRGGLEGAEFTWGDDDPQETVPLANTWQGRFPYENTKLDGWAYTSPVGSYPPNGYGLHDMAGNVVGVDLRPLPAPCGRSAGIPLLRPADPRRRPGANPSDQGRFAPLHHPVLLQIPARRSPVPNHRHLHHPHRIPLHFPLQTLRAINCAARMSRPLPNHVLASREKKPS